MAQVIRYFKCPFCKGGTAFDAAAISKPETNSIKCSQCSRNWVGTVLPSCCGKIQILWGFSGLGLTKPSYHRQTYPK